MTVGIAIPVPEPYGSELRKMRAGFGDPMAETVPSHVTLLPPIDYEADALDDVSPALERASVSIPPFPMRLRAPARSGPCRRSCSSR